MAPKSGCLGYVSNFHAEPFRDLPKIHKANMINKWEISAKTLNLTQSLDMIIY